MSFLSIFLPECITPKTAPAALHHDHVVEKKEYTRESEMEGWVVLNEETTTNRQLTYADIAAGRKKQQRNEDLQASKSVHIM